MRFGLVAQLALIWLAATALLFAVGGGWFSGGEKSSAVTEMGDGDPDARLDGPVIIGSPSTPEQTTGDTAAGVPPIDIGSLNSRILTPADDGAADTAFQTVRSALRAAISARDLATVLTHVADDVKVSFDDETGTEDFRSLFGDAETGEAYWLRLEEAMDGGSVRKPDGSLCLPYYACSGHQPAMQGIDAFNSVVVIAEDVPVRQGPDAQSKVIGTVSFAVIDLISFLDDQVWAEVRLPNGREGFIDRASIKEPIGFRATFEQRSGVWKLTSFRSGNE